MWEVDSDIIARESARDRRETAAETVRRRKTREFNLVVQKKKKAANFTSIHRKKLKIKCLFLQRMPNPGFEVQKALSGFRRMVMARD